VHAEYDWGNVGIETRELYGSLFEDEVPIRSKAIAK